MPKMQVLDDTVPQRDLVAGAGREVLVERPFELCQCRGALGSGSVASDRERPRVTSKRSNRYGSSVRRRPVNTGAGVLSVISATAVTWPSDERMMRGI